MCKTQDVERLFGSSVIAFMKARRHESEAKFWEVVTNWRRAIDEHGLTSASRQAFLQAFKQYICEDLMPWFKDQPDLSLLEVNR